MRNKTRYVINNCIGKVWLRYRYITVTILCLCVIMNDQKIIYNIQFKGQVAIYALPLQALPILLLK